MYVKIKQINCVRDGVMNIFKKIYCRTYQLILRLAMPFLPYREPVLIKDYQQMADILNSKNLKNILLVTDKTLKNLGLTGELEDVLKNNGINVFIYDETVWKVLLRKKIYKKTKDKEPKSICCTTWAN